MHFSEICTQAPYLGAFFMVIGEEPSLQIISNTV